MTIDPLNRFWKCAAAGSGLMAMLVALVFSTGCIREGWADTASMPASSSIPAVVTADIQAGIERHIEEQVRVGGGYYRLQFKDRELRLKLVRVHTEYLANLGPRRHFACVDLADISGDVYDVDFFMSGDPGSMTVTETTVHKINGQPYYAWEQKKDKTWHRIPIERASEGHFGVIRGRDNFEFKYWAKLPQLTTPARMWLPLPETDRFQTVEIISLQVPGKQRMVHDRKNSNRIWSWTSLLRTAARRSISASQCAALKRLPMQRQNQENPTWHPTDSCQSLKSFGQRRALSSQAKRKTSCERGRSMIM